MGEDKLVIIFKNFWGYEYIRIFEWSLGECKEREESVSFVRKGTVLDKLGKRDQRDEGISYGFK